MNSFFRFRYQYAGLLKTILLSVAVSAGTCAASLQAVPHDDMAVNVKKVGEEVAVDLTVTIDATPQETWNVLTDYEHMPLFLSNLKSSKVLEKNGSIWTVGQTGKTTIAGFSFSFEAIREVELKPYESLRSHLISGTLKKHEGYTQLIPSGGGTRIVYHSTSISNIWVPSSLGTSIVEDEVRKQYKEIEAEILRRKANAKLTG